MGNETISQLFETIVAFFVIEIMFLCSIVMRPQKLLAGTIAIPVFFRHIVREKQQLFET